MSEPIGPSPERRGMTLPLVDLLPGLDRRLGEDDRRVAARARVPVLAAFEGTFDLHAILCGAKAFAVVIVEGVVLRSVGCADHSGLQLLGPGDLLSRPAQSACEMVSCAQLQARGVVRYAPLDDRVLALCQRYPRLIEGLQMRSEGQQQRLLAQLLICQRPRVEDRVEAILWLLAETWGRVTPSGTVLPITLTHDAIGLLVGARRSTVTLALGSLESRGRLLRRSQDWLLLERPRPAVTSVPIGGLPRLVVPAAGSPWTEPSRRSAPERRVDAMTQLHARWAAAMEQSRTGIETATAAARRSRDLQRRSVLRRSDGDGLHQEDDAGDLSVAVSGADR